MDNGDNIIKPVLICHCGHCPDAEAVWGLNADPEVPDLAWKNFPSNGRAILSRKTIFLACRMCSKDLTELNKSFGTVFSC